MVAADVIILEQKGNSSVGKLRQSKFAKGLPFMINSKDLPQMQCFLEYPDGRIILATLRSANDHDFTVVRELGIEEANNLRDKLGFAK